MDNKKFIPLFVFLALLFILSTHFSSPVTGKAAGNYYTYLPLIFSPPEPPAWVGPYGGHVSASAAHGNIVYAGTWGGGVYKSTDGGATWASKSAGIASLYITAIAIDPQNPKIAYAGINPQVVGLDPNPGIYKTTDGGETWFPIGNGIDPEESVIVYDIAIDPHDGENILISTRGKSNNGGPPWQGVVYRSTDQGYTWEPKLTEVGGKGQRDWVYTLAISYQNPRLVYAATHEHGIFRSDTFGNKNWEAVNTGISDFSTRGVVINPLSAEPYAIVYAGTWLDGSIFRSNNGGNDWFGTGSAPDGAHIISMNIDPGGSIIYAATFRNNGLGGGVLRSTDGGNTWSISGLSGMDVIHVAVDSQNASQVYSGTDGQGLFKSTNYGATWAACRDGMHATNVNALLVAADNNQELFASVDTMSVQHTADGGLSWSSLDNEIEETNVLALASPPDSPRTLYALTNNSGLYRCNLSDISNDCWTPVRIDFPRSSYPNPALAPQTPFTAIPFIQGAPAPASPSAKPALQKMVFAPSSPHTAYMATYGAGVYKSQDSGATWARAGLSSQSLIALIVDSGDENHIFAASYTQVWQSADGGVTWEDTNFSGADVYALALDNAGNLYAGTSNGIYRYQSGGWTHLAFEGLPVPEVVSRPDKTGWLYAGTISGLYISHDGGINWTSGPAELNGLVINAITLAPNTPGLLYASTTTQGVLRFQDSQ